MAESKALKNISVIIEGNKNKTYTFGFITIVVVLILLLGAVRPTILTINRINKEVSDKKILNQNLDDKLNALQKLSNEYEYLREDIDYLPLVFPTQGNFSLFMTNIDALAKDSGFDLSTINFSPEDRLKTGTSVLVPWSVKININGPQSNLITFLEKVEAMPMAPVITEVSFSRNKNGGQSGNISINIVIYRVEDLKFYE